MFSKCDCRLMRSIRALEKKGDPRIPIIVLSANAFEEDRQRSLACGMDAHLAKPVDLEALCAVLRATLR